MLIFGPEGLGKSTWAASAPAPIFLPGEEGTNHLDVARLPQPHTWEEVLEAVRMLTEEPHEYQTFVVDTLDGIEPLVWQAVCARGGKADIEAFGYGKGYVAALDEWRKFLHAIERLRRVRGMNVLFVAHTIVKHVQESRG